MTLRDISIALKYIDKRKHNTYAMQAALHGHKIKLKGDDPGSDEEKSEFSKEDDSAADRAIKAAIERKNKEAEALRNRR